MAAAKCAEVCHLLGVVMTAEKHAESDGPSLLDVVALLADAPGEGLARGQVGIASANQAGLCPSLCCVC
jgi:hypothetical protein